VREIIFYVLLFLGLFFFLVGTIGILRFPDVLTRAHSAAKCDTLGAILSISAIAVYGGLNTSTVKLVLIIVFIWITNPTATHLIANAYSKSIKKNDTDNSSV